MKLAWIVETFAWSVEFERAPKLKAIEPEPLALKTTGVELLALLTSRQYAGATAALHCSMNKVLFVTTAL
jgi:hypothetical protein